MVVQPDGKIVLCGAAASYDLALVRFNSNGEIDTDFGDLKGCTVLRRDIGGAIGKSVFYTPADKKLLVSAWYYYDADHQVAALRYDDDGILDSSYGVNGVASGGFSGNKYGTDLTSGEGILQSDGKMVVSGSFLQNYGDTYNVALFRFTNQNNKQQIIATKIRRWLQHHGIMWQTDNNVRYYTVQHSTDGGVIYKQVAKIYNNHQPACNYEDAVTNSGGNDCYRIMAMGKDGLRTFSNTVFIDEAAKVYPNPVRNNMQLQGLPTDSRTNISILDFNGNVRTTVTASGGNASINISNLSPGNYLLKLQHNNTITTQTFVKE